MSSSANEKACRISDCPLGGLYIRYRVAASNATRQSFSQKNNKCLFLLFRNNFEEITPNTTLFLLKRLDYSLSISFNFLFSFTFKFLFSRFHSLCFKYIGLNKLLFLFRNWRFRLHHSQRLEPSWWQGVLEHQEGIMDYFETSSVWHSLRPISATSALLRHTEKAS